MFIYFLVVILGLFLIIICCFFIGFPKQAENITWGVNFSQKHTEGLGLDWRETYLAILDDLGARNIKIAAHWDFIEGKEENYYFDDLDWQIREAEKREAKIILVIGMKTPRWPECHIPEWAVNLSKEKQQEKILKLVEEIVLRYRESKAIKYWQVENEPFFSFGECPWYDKKLRKTDILWTKPSELSFYTGLGIPTIIAPSIGSQEDFNRKWLQAIGAGVLQENPRYANQWIFDYLNSGRFAEAALDGFIEVEKLGTYNIKKIVFEQK